MESVILSETIDDHQIAVFLKNGVLWDLEVNTPHSVIAATITRQDKTQKAVYAQTDHGSEVIIYDPSLRSGQTIHLEIIRHPRGNKVPVARITNQTKISPHPAETLLTRYQVWEPKHLSEAGILESHDVFSILSQLNHRHITLDNEAGSITVEPTEAMITVDVNSNASTSTMKTNLAAAKMLARFLRIRKWGGIVMVDFIRMKDKKNQDQLESKLKSLMQDDPMQTDCHGYTRTGLYEMTRAQTSPDPFVVLDNFLE